jgi:hypothetical protein
MKVNELLEAVGRITKQNQTVDVGPDEVTKQAAKFGNKVDKDGRPPTLSKKVKGKSTNVAFNLGMVEGQAINNPKNTFLTKSDTAYDFLRVGKTISNLSTAKKSDNRDEPDVMIVPFGGKKEKDHLKKGLKKSGYKTQDADKPGDDAHVDEASDLVLDKESLIKHLQQAIKQYAQEETDIEKLSYILQKLNGKTVKTRSNTHFTVTDEDIQEALRRLSESVEEGPKDFDDMKLDTKGKQDSIDYFYKDHAPSMGKPVKAGKLGSHDIVTVTKGPTTLMFLVDANDSAVFYVAFDKYQDGVAIGNVRSNGTVKATGVYAYLVKKYGKLYSDAHQTPGGRKIWDNLSKYTKLKVTDVGDRLVATENFADGKVKGKSRPGRVKRSGASCNGSVTALRKRAKNASGEKAKMYHWCANMKSGKKK